MKPSALKDLSFDDLVALRSEIDAVLSARIDDEKRALEEKIAKLSGLPDAAKPVARHSGSAPHPGPLKGSKVPPRFYNPDNPSEMWSGRGLRPRWMVAALAAGRNLEDMLIEEPADLPKVQRAKFRKRGRVR